MSRSGYSEDLDTWALIRWRGAVESAIRGKRGQKVLSEIADALDALPRKTLAAESLITEVGEFCTLGALGRARGLDMQGVDPDDRDAVARLFGIPEALAAEIMYLNDEHEPRYDWENFQICGPIRPWESNTKWIRTERKDSAERRWTYMRKWVDSKLAKHGGAA